jgi:Ni/Co efflux regulator RcnB
MEKWGNPGRKSTMVVKDWQKRGVRRPGRNAVYVTNGGDIYLAVAATFLATGLIN